MKERKRYQELESDIERKRERERNRKKEIKREYFEYILLSTLYN